jgi:2-polyprenyl-6-methoxyphenol hydroxylase-like FAD-dependent oxidoreductase
MQDVGDVLIVGAGPVGLFTALALAQTGADVTVIEAEESISDSPRAMVYFPSSMVALKELGILEEVEKQGVRNSAVGHKVPDLDFYATLSLTALTGITFDYQIHAGQDVAARIALDHLRQRGARVLFNHQLLSLDQRSDRVVATVQTPEGAQSFQAKWMIGCDGARSTVRKLLDIEFEGLTWPERFVATNVYCDFSSLGLTMGNFICDPTYMAVIGLIDADGLWRLTYQEDGDLPAESFMERLPERYAYHIPKGMKFEIKSARPYVLHQRCAARLRDGRVLLAGDAAHATNPCGGLGLTTGVWDGMILSDVLGAVLRGEAKEDLLDLYSDERRDVFWKVTSPGATENKRIMREADPTRRRQDCDAIQALADDPNLARLMMGFPFRTIGNVLRPESRWRAANPMPAAGVDLDQRKSQLL